MFSFSQRKKEMDLQSCIRRITDLTAPNRSPLEGDSRVDNRCNRTVPVLLVPWENDQPIVEEATIALTKDFSDLGVALVLHSPFHGDEVLLGFLPPPQDQSDNQGKPFFMLGKLRQNVPLGGGYWQLGIELFQLLELGELKSLNRLLPMIEKLSPGPVTHGMSVPDAI